MVSGVLSLEARGTGIAEPLGRWQEYADQAGLLPVLGGWLYLAEGLFVRRAVDAQVAIRDEALGWPERVLASISVAVNDTSYPTELMTAHVCWANAFPRLNASFFPIADVERLVTDAWLGIADRPFLLRMPSTTVPELRTACASNTRRGWRKVGEVLSAAEHAIPATVPASMRQTIRDLIA
jgi:hypothetical protein